MSFEQVCAVCGDPDCYGPSGRHRLDTEPHPVTDLTLAPASDFKTARARWKAAEDAEESTVERVALAILRADYPEAKSLAGEIPEWQRLYRTRARAAIDAITTPVRQETGQ